MIRLSKAKDKRPFFPKLTYNQVGALITMGLIVFFFGSIGFASYLIDYRVGKPAQKVIRNIEQHPEQWAYDASVSGLHQFKNEQIGVLVTKLTDPSTRHVSVAFVEGERSVEPFNRLADRSAIYEALDARIEGGLSNDGIADRVFEKLDR